MNKCFFEYLLQDAWHRNISDIKIYDQTEENVFCTIYDSFKIVDKTIYSLSKENIDKLKLCITNEILSIDNESLESPIVFDGVINNFIYYINNKNKELNAYNLWAIVENPKFYKNYKYCHKLLHSFFNMKKILIANGVDEKIS